MLNISVPAEMDVPSVPLSAKNVRNTVTIVMTTSAAAVISAKTAEKETAGVTTAITAVTA